MEIGRVRQTGLVRDDYTRLSGSQLQLGRRSRLFCNVLYCNFSRSFLQASMQQDLLRVRANDTDNYGPIRTNNTGAANINKHMTE